MKRLFCSNLSLSAAVLILLIPPLEASAQMRTVGDGTVFMFNPGKSESYGIGGNDIGAFKTESFNSRHNRLGTSTGIGSSFLQTTSPTSESRPATPTTFASFSGSGYQNYPLKEGGGSPALGDYAGGPQGSFLGRTPFTQSVLSTTDSGQSLSTVGSFGYSGPGSTNFDLNALPSFSRRGRSILPLSGGSDQMFRKIEPGF